MTRVVVTSISRERLSLGEGPLWHPLWQELLVVDVDVGHIHRFDAQLTALGRISIGRTTSALTWQPDGSLLCYHDRGEIARLAHPEGVPQTVLTLPGLAASRFNDVIADARGRVLCGTLGTSDMRGRLYRIDTNGHVEQVLDGLGEPNGLAFSVDGRRLFLADSGSGRIWRFSYDARTGHLTDQQLFHETRDDELPDGLTVDADDRLYVAVWNGSCVLRFSASGVLEDRVELGPRWVTSLTFGGMSHETVFVTSARPSAQDGTAVTVSPLDGAVLRLELGIQGRPENPSRFVP